MANLETFWVRSASKGLASSFTCSLGHWQCQKMGSKTLRFGKLFFCGRVGAACVAAFVLISSDRNQAYARELVNWGGDHGMGTIIVKTPERKLCFVLGKGMALRHDVAVGKDGMQWSGETFVQGKSRNPGWMPTPRMRHENPAPPAHMLLRPTNPLVSRAVGPTILFTARTFPHRLDAPLRAAASGCTILTSSIYSKEVISRRRFR